MRLKDLQIQGHKNLSDFKIDFEDDNFINILVGKNGSGKSNVLEAVIKISDSVFDTKKKGQPDKFSRTLLVRGKIETIILECRRILIPSKAG